MLKKLIDMLLPWGKWETVFVTQDQVKYFVMKEKLLSHRIEIKTKIINNNGRAGSGRSVVASFGFIPDTYEILVRKEDVYKANHSMQHR